MSLPNSANPAPPVQKQGTNVYTMMLILSFIAIVTSCVLLHQELSRFGNYPWWNTGAAAGS